MSGSGSIPGIYVAVKGDFTALQQDLKQARQVVTEQARGMSNDLNNALSPNQIRNSVNSLVSNLSSLANNSKLTGANFKSLGVDFGELGRISGLTGAQLQKLQQQLLQTKAANSQEASLRNIAKQAGLTGTEIRTLGVQFGLSNKQIESVTNSVSGISGASQKAGASISRLVDQVKGLVIAYAGFKVLEEAKEVVTLAARYETLGVVMDRLGQAQGHSKEELDRYAEGLQKTGISMVESRQGIIRLIQANLDFSESSKLARIAQDAAVIGNVNSSEAFDKMMQGIVTGQSILLHHLGLMTNFETAYQRAAKAVGKTTNDLSEHEKMQIRLNEVIRSGEGIVGAYESAMSTAGKQLLSMTRYLQDFAVKLGTPFLPEFTKTVHTATEELKHMSDALNGDFGKKTIEAAKNELDNIFQVLTAITNIFGALPPEITGAAGVGIIGMMLFGRKGFALLAGGSVLVDWAKDMGKLAGAASLDQISWWEVIFANDITRKKTLDDLAKAEDSMRRMAAHQDVVNKDKMIMAGVGTEGTVMQPGTLAAEYEKRNPKSPSTKNNSLASDMNAANNAEVGYLKAVEEKKAEIIKAAVALEQQTNEHAYALGVESYKKYLSDKLKYTIEGLNAELVAKQKELADAQNAANNLSAITDELGNARPDKDRKAEYDALKKVETAEKAVIEARNKLDLAQAAGAQDLIVANRDTVKSYQEIQIQLLDTKGKSLEAARAQAQIDDQSVERLRLIAAAREGDAKAEQALQDLREKSAITISKIELDLAAKSHDAAISIADINGEYQKSIDLQLELVKIEIERAKLAGATPQEINLLQRQGEEIEKMKTPMGALSKGLKDFSVEYGNTTKNLLEAATEAAQGMQGAFQDFFFDSMQGNLKSLGDYIKSFLTSVQQALAQVLSRQVVSGLTSLISGLGMTAVGAVAGGTTSGIGAVGNTTYGAYSGTLNAHGNVYSTPSLSAYRNQIVDKPTTFKFANGMMGEAGAEGIVPLKRMKSGNLGVESSGGSSVNIQVINNGGSVQTEQQPNDTGGVDLKIVFDAMQAQNINRQGSASNRAVANMTGAQPQLIRR